MKLSEFENKLQEHGQSVKSHIILSPLDYEKEDLNMIKPKSFIKSFVAVFALISVLTTTALAAYNYLSADKIADIVGDKKLAEVFKGSDVKTQTLSDGNYKATIMGITSGQNISEFKSSQWDVVPDRTYVAVAIEKTDATPMTYDDELLVTPLIQGLAPWRYNVYTMGGGRSAYIMDGVYYCIVEFDSIEAFADRQIYLAVIGNTFYDKNAYNYDEKTGLISPNKDYDKANILFEVNLDKSKADSKKAEEYIRGLDKDLGVEEDSEYTNEDMEKTAEEEKSYKIFSDEGDIEFKVEEAK